MDQLFQLRAATILTRIKEVHTVYRRCSLHGFIFPSQDVRTCVPISIIVCEILSRRNLVLAEDILSVGRYDIKWLAGRSMFYHLPSNDMSVAFFRSYELSVDSVVTLHLRSIVAFREQSCTKYTVYSHILHVYIYTYYMYIQHTYKARQFCKALQGQAIAALPLFTLSK